MVVVLLALKVERQVVNKRTATEYESLLRSAGDFILAKKDEDVGKKTGRGRDHQKKKRRREGPVPRELLLPHFYLGLEGTETGTQRRHSFFPQTNLTGQT